MEPVSIETTSMAPTSNFLTSAVLWAALLLVAGCGGGGDSQVPSPYVEGPVTFRHRVIDPAPPGGPDCCTDVCAAGDLDGDGYADLVLGSEHADGPGLYWYQYPLWDKRPLASGQFTTDMQLADLDRDGRLDIVVGDTDRGLVWLRNPGVIDGDWDLGDWDLQVIGAGYVHDLEVGDIDADGDIDIATCDKQAVRVWVQTAPGAWQARGIIERDGEGTHLADLDRDGDLDLVLGGLWFEAPADPLAGEWTRHDFAPGWNKDARVQTGDIDRDGRLDVALTASEGEGPIAWFAAPADPREGAWIEHPVGALTLTGAHSLQLADFDGDGDLDLATAEMHTGGKHVLIYLQSADGWIEEQLAVTGSHNLRAFDLGNDGDIDLAGKNYGGEGRVFELWENQTTEKALRPELAVDATGVVTGAWAYEPIDTARGDDQFGTMGLVFCDADHDGRPDVVAGSLLYLNRGGKGNAWPRVSLPAGVDVFFAEDIDGDPLADLVGFRGDQALWLEATGPDGAGWTERGVATVPKGRTQGATVAELVPGGARELAFTRGMHLCFLQIPPDPAQPWALVTVADPTEEEAVAALDLDGDGQVDLVTTTRDGFHLVAFANPGPGAAVSGAWPAHILATTPGRADRIIPADVDGDGRLDLVVTEESGDLEYNAAVAWFAAPAEPYGSPWPRHALAVVRSANSLEVADFDGDGRPDVATAEHTDMQPGKVAPDNRTFLLLNRGSGAGWPALAVDQGPRSSHLGTRARDLDGDGDLDLVSTAWRQFATLHAWYNPGSVP
jgi:hypothetical protein